MAPLITDPRELLVVLNPTRRRALYTLLFDITAYMRTQLELSPEEEAQQQQRQQSSASTPFAGRGTAPLFHAETSGPNSGNWDDDRDLQPHGEKPAPKQAAPVNINSTLRTLRRDALKHFDTWRKETLSQVKELVTTPDDAQITEARRQRVQQQQQAAKRSAAAGEDLISFGDGPSAPPQTASADAATDAQKKAVAALQELYHAIPSKFPSLPADDRRATLSAVLLLLLSSGRYSALSRVLVVYLASALALPLTALTTEETEIAVSLVEAAARGMSADAEAERRRKEGQASRFWKVGLASVAGAAVIGITGGLAAPVVAGAIGGLMGTVGLGGVASFLGIFWMNGALVGTLFGAFGAKMTGEMVDNYAKEVQDFRFLPLKEEWGRDYAKPRASTAPAAAASGQISQAAHDGDKDRRLRVTIGINGWLTSKEDVTKPWRVLSDSAEVFALRYELGSLVGLGTALEGMVTSYAWSVVKTEILRRTVLASLWAALWPAYLLSMATSLDNPFSLARNRSDKAGRVLADALINRVQGERPVTLVGYSLGAAVIWSCLRSLAERRAFGLVDTVVLIGAPVPSHAGYWQARRSVVAGKIFNVYSRNDYILGFLYRAATLQMGVAGLQAIEGVDGVENLDLSDEVAGHLRYPELIAQILTRCGFENVHGGEGPIEKEEDVDIALHDAEAGAEMGTLIQLRDLPPGSSTKMAPRRQPPGKKTYSDELLSSLQPEGSEAGKDVAQGPRTDWTKVSRTNNSAVADFSDPLRPLEEADLRAAPKLLASTNEKYLAAEMKPLHRGSASSTSGRSASGASGMLTPTTTVSHAALSEDESDGGEESWGGITMHDNDEDGEMSMTTYMEPLRLDD